MCVCIWQVLYVCMYLAACLEWLLNLTKKKKKVCWKEMIKARERYLTGSFKKKKFGRLVGIDVEFDPKKKKVCWKEII